MADRFTQVLGLVQIVGQAGVEKCGTVEQASTLTKSDPLVLIKTTHLPLPSIAVCKKGILACQGRATKWSERSEDP